MQPASEEYQLQTEDVNSPPASAVDANPAPLTKVFSANSSTTVGTNSLEMQLQLFPPQNSDGCVTEEESIDMGSMPVTDDINIGFSSSATNKLMSMQSVSSTQSPIKIDAILLTKKASIPAVIEEKIAKSDIVSDPMVDGILFIDDDNASQSPSYKSHSMLLSQSKSTDCEQQRNITAIEIVTNEKYISSKNNSENNSPTPAPTIESIRVKNIHFEREKSVDIDTYDKKMTVKERMEILNKKKIEKHARKQSLTLLKLHKLGLSGDLPCIASPTVNSPQKISLIGGSAALINPGAGLSMRQRAILQFQQRAQKNKLQQNRPLQKLKPRKSAKVLERLQKLKEAKNLWRSKVIPKTLSSPSTPTIKKSSDLPLMLSYSLTTTPTAGSKPIKRKSILQETIKAKLFENQDSWKEKYKNNSLVEDEMLAILRNTDFNGVSERKKKHEEFHARIKEKSEIGWKQNYQKAKSVPKVLYIFTNSYILYFLCLSFCKKCMFVFFCVCKRK